MTNNEEGEHLTTKLAYVHTPIATFLRDRLLGA